MERSLPPLVALLALSGPAAAQATFSQDWHGPVVGLPDGLHGVPITEGDILVPATPTMLPALGPLPVPGLERSGGVGPPAPGLGIPSHSGCVGHAFGTLCPTELDAWSHGIDDGLDPAAGYLPGGNLWFSVDSMATGFPAPIFPSVFSEAGVADAAADVFVDLGLLLPPLPPFAMPPANVGVIDGDGLPSGTGYAYPGVGLVEPTAPGAVPNVGSNLDAFDRESPLGSYPGFFSLASAFPDPLTGVVGNASAPVNGFVGGDVLAVSGPSGPPTLYAPAAALGLDMAGPDSDDLDALILLENGTGVFEPSLHPFDWIGGGTDMLLFSVRRGSAVVGTPDSIFGLPIEEGDLLTTPAVPGGPPGIFIAAENLGLATLRSGTTVFPFGDDLDAADSAGSARFDCDGDGVEDAVAIATGLAADADMDGVPDACSADCNGNGVPDAVDIASGTSADANGNGRPDECEETGPPYCFGDGTGTPCPCGNSGLAGHGCDNSLATGGALLTASGQADVAADTVTLAVSGIGPTAPVLFFQGTTSLGAGVPFGDGLRCVGGTVIRLGIRIASGGSASYGFLAGDTPISSAVLIAPPVTRYYQTWYRDGAAFCTPSPFNLSNAMTIVWP